MRRWLVCLCVAMTATAVLVENVFALHSMESAVTEAGEKSSLNFRGQVGMLNGEAREIVYNGVAVPEDPDYKVSELVWDLKNVLMAGGVLSIGGGSDTVLNAGLWFGINEGVDGEMEDYDWLDETTSAWTDYSRSEVDVIEALMFDLNMTHVFSDTDFSKWAICFGFSYDSWEWDDRGQEYIYSVNSFRDTVGSFGGVNVIDYRQWFFVPYIGLEASTDLGGVSLQGYVVYSPFVLAEDEDYHVLRGIKFKETFEGGTCYGFGGALALDLGESVFVQAAADYQVIEEIIGDMEITNLGSFNEDGAGISHESLMISVAIGLRL